MFVSFIISAIIHEIVVTFAQGFFFPILFILFVGPGIVFIMLTKKAKGGIWNIFMWLMLASGTSMLLVFYVHEYITRTAISEDPDDTTPVWLWDEGLTWYDMMVPKSLGPVLSQWKSNKS